MHFHNNKLYSITKIIWSGKWHITTYTCIAVVSFMKLHQDEALSLWIESFAINFHGVSTILYSGFYFPCKQIRKLICGLTASCWNNMQQGKLVDKKSLQSTCIKPVDNLQQSLSREWRRQPDVWSCKCKFFCVYKPYKVSISKEMNNDNDLNLHSMTKLLGRLHLLLITRKSAATSYIKHKEIKMLP